MKTLLAGIFALTILAAAAHADRVLIYNGTQVDKSDGVGPETYHMFVLFDLDTQQYEVVTYSPVKGSNVNTVGAPEPIYYLSLVLSPHKSQTNFTTFSGSTIGSTVSYYYLSYTGINSLLNLGTISGAFPKTLVYSYRALYSTGPTSTILFQDTGIYHIETAMTVQSNDHSYNLSQAANQVVEAYVLSKGY